MPDAPTVLALDVSGSRTLLRLVRDGLPGDGAEVANGGRLAPAYWAEVLDAAVGLAGRDVAAAGIAFGGPVSSDGRILSIHVGGWSELDPAGALAERLGLPVVLDNDANCGAVGEYTYGRHTGAASLVFMTCSTGIGGGIVQHGELFRGARGLAGEVGHMPVVPDGRPCSCGSRGCLEAHCSGTAIAERCGLPNAKAAFESGDPAVRATLAEVFAEFGRGIAAIHNAFDPAVILIGGGVSLAGEALCGPVAAAARPYVMSHRREHLRLEPASLGLEAQLLGAAALAVSRLSGGGR